MTLILNINGISQSIHIDCDDISPLRELHHAFFESLTDACDNGGILRIKKVKHEDGKQTYLITLDVLRRAE